MKKIILSMALSVLFLFGSIASFLVNDVTAFAGWAGHNYPRMADEFDRRMGRFGPDRPGPPERPPRGGPRERDDRFERRGGPDREGGYDHREGPEREGGHHMRRPGPPPALTRDQPPR